MTKKQQIFTKADLLEQTMNEFKEQNNDDHEEILKQIGEIDTKLDKAFVTKTEWEPYKKAIWIVVSTFILATVGAILKLVIK